MSKIVTPTPKSFTPFPRLCAELRLQVWADALPKPVGPILLPYRRDIFRDGFDHHLITDTELPTAFACKESRAVAMKWARDHGYRLRAVPSGMDNPFPVFVRPPDLRRDALWVTAQTMQTFCDTVEGVIFARGAVTTGMRSKPSEVVRIAVSMWAVDVVLPWLMETLEMFPSLRYLYVLSGPGESTRSWNSVLELDRGYQEYEAEDTPWGALAWDVARQQLCSSGGEWVGAEGIKNVSKDDVELVRELDQILRDDGMQAEFEVRRIRAVSK